MNERMLDPVNQYYTQKIHQHGPSAAGVDWNGDASQHLRFEQLSRLCEAEAAFSVNDLGCGYGAMLDFWTGRGQSVDYLGVDISAAMVEQAVALHQGRGRFIVAGQPDRVADYTVASGIFNVRLEAPADEWKAHMARVIDAMRAASTKGFAFNCLTSYSDAPHMKDYLYYADPCEWFDYCKRRYSRNVALMHDYGLYEFTLIIRL